MMLVSIEIEKHHICKDLYSICDPSPNSDRNKTNLTHIDINIVDLYRPDEVDTGTYGVPRPRPPVPLPAGVSEGSNQHNNGEKKRNRPNQSRGEVNCSFILLFISYKKESHRSFSVIHES